MGNSEKRVWFEVIKQEEVLGHSTLETSRNRRYDDEQCGGECN